MTAYATFIRARLDENTLTIPAPVIALLRSLTATHDGGSGYYCDGCGTDQWEEGVVAEACEQAHEIAALWDDHPDYPGKPTTRQELVKADRDGKLPDIPRIGSLMPAGLAVRTPAGVYLTPRGRELLPSDHEATRAPYLWFDWGRDLYPYPAPTTPTVEDVHRYPAYYLCGPGRPDAETTRCPHDLPLTARCHTCDE